MTAPQHSATAPIRFIPRTDPAWQLDDFPDEVDELGSRAGEHPLGRYFRGETRFDLDASGFAAGEVRTARQYLKADAKPTTWLLRRLRIGEVARCRDMAGHAGALQAFQLGLVGVENPPPGVEVPNTGLARQLTEKQADAIADVIGARLAFEIGEAAMLASEAPTSAEKKP